MWREVRAANHVSCLPGHEPPDERLASCGSARVAERFSRAVYQTFHRIKTAPDKGNQVEFDAPELEGVRYMAVRGLPNYAVWYRVSGTQIEVVRVLHAAQDVETELAN